ncbi:ATP-binding protein [Methylobacter sp. S3L5C]|uniref:ATP-binding protein n=1 Tax=Methylobacter sp. S3L5C TaxID=2839024 RepID=UPI001FAC0CCD|nr:ATP-binding protein [Methylobacter sp. S3L5C]UOA07813.1 ATP-binding protein [Methylobacter sp. S3L5C]
MRFKYVKTSNHQLFMSLVNAVETGAAKGAKGIVIAGDPGAGKSTTADHYGAERNAIYIEGMPGMTISYVRDLLAYELAVTGLKGFALQKAIIEAMSRNRQPIILDEAQHGLEKKAAVLEYLRRIADQVGVVFILVCHSSEKHRFAEHKLAHIATRISAVVDFKPANLLDTQLYLRELCEVLVDEGIARQVLEQSRGRYRLMTSAINTLEALAAKLNKSELAESDVRGYLLCEDAMRSLRVRTSPDQLARK